MATVTVVVLIVTLLVVVVVAFIAVGHAVGSTEAMPRQIVVDSHEAIEFCAQALPDRITASLSYDDLRRLIRLHMEWLQAYHWAPDSSDATPIVFEQYDPLAYVMERCHAVDLEVSAEEAAAVIEAHSDYLRVIGALHIDDPVQVEADLAQFPLLEQSEIGEVDRLESGNHTANPPPDDLPESSG